MTAFQSSSCRLCLNICNEHRSLYDEDGRGNEVYALTDKYFAPLYLDMKCVDQLRVICMECWRHMSEFHTFQQMVLEAQNKYTDEVVVKSEVETQMDGVDQSMVTYEICNLGPGDFTNAMFSQSRGNDSCGEHDVARQYEAIVKSEVEEPLDDRGRAFCSYNETVEKSELEQQEICSLGTEDFTHAATALLSQDRGSVQQSEAIVKSEVEEPLNDRGSAFCSYNEAIVKSELEQEEICNLVTEDQDRGSASCSADGTVQQSEANVVSYDAESADEQWDELVYPVGEFDSASQCQMSESEGSGGNSSTDDECEATTRRAKTCIKGVESIKGKLQSKAITQHEKQIQTTTLKRLQTPQDYDDLIAQWRPNLECELCYESYASFSLLQQHFVKQHPSEKCHIICCELKFYHRYEIEKHIQFHTQPNGFKCEVCFKCFATKSNLQKHMHIKHSGEPKEKPFKCSKCPKSYSSEKLLANHLPRCDTERNLTSLKVSKEYKCEECGRAYKTLRILQRHIRKEHLGLSKIGTNKCTICDKVFNYPVGFRDHMASHEAKPIHACPFCPEKFVLRVSLSGHLHRRHRTEWAEKKKEKAAPKHRQIYKCGSCENVYSTRVGFREHMTKHTGQPMYTCLFCPMTFTYRAVSWAHVKKEHYKEWEEKRLERKNIYKCASCEKAYETLLELREHQATH